MVLVLSHRSALYYWRTFAGRRADLKPLRNPSAMTEPASLDGNLTEELASLGLFPTKDHPLDLLFSSADLRPRNAVIKPHVDGTALAPGSLLLLTDRIAVTSPELTFLHMAREYSRGRLILAGCEFCGTYVRRPDGALSGTRPALTCAADLRAFIARRHPGATSRAADAARFVLDGAASPMEAKVALLLSLPTCLGGCGLPQPVLNRPFALSTQAQRLYPHSPCRLDLSWSGVHLNVEYDGRDTHTGEDHARDVARWAALGLDGVDVMVLTKEQVYDMEAFAIVANRIVGKLSGNPGRTPRIRTKDYPAKQVLLRRQLHLL